MLADTRNRVRVGAEPKTSTCYTDEEMDQKRAQITLYGLGAAVAGVAIGYWFRALNPPKRGSR